MAAATAARTNPQTSHLSYHMDPHKMLFQRDWTSLAKGLLPTLLTASQPRSRHRPGLGCNLGQRPECKAELLTIYAVSPMIQFIILF